MLNDKDIVFVTTTLHSIWLDYQKKLVSRYFPESQHIIVDGRNNWPNAWFYWMDEVKDSGCKWFIHLDEDCFIEGREEVIKLLEKMEAEDITLSAVSDGYHHYRGANPIAINSFFMAGNIEHVTSTGIDYRSMKFWLTNDGWRNNLDILYDVEKHSERFDYPHEIQGNGANYAYEQEPYYALLWKLKEAGRKFYYLYPYFDERFKSTNPRIDKDSPDIAIHMWYTRQWQTPMMVHGTPNFTRYQRVEQYLKSK